MAQGLADLAQAVTQFALAGAETGRNSRQGIATCTAGSETVMRKETIQAIARRKMHSPIRTVVLCGLAAFNLTVPAAAKDIALNSGGALDLYATVSAVHEVSAGNPMPGLHLDAKVNGRITDIYIAPMDFIAKFGVKVSRGDNLHIVGTRVTSGDADVVLAREINVGSYGRNDRVFRPNLTVYLRNDDGPFWVEATKPGPDPMAAR